MNVKYIEDKWTITMSATITENVTKKLSGIAITKI